MSFGKIVSPEGWPSKEEQNAQNISKWFLFASACQMHEICLQYVLQGPVELLLEVKKRKSQNLGFAFLTPGLEKFFNYGSLTLTEFTAEVAALVNTATLSA